MRCERYQAVIPLSTCLSRQKEMASSTGDKHLGFKPGTGHPCQGCEQAEGARKGEENNMDIDELKAQVSRGDVPIITRKCSKCGQTKQASQFYKHNEVCRKCSAIISKARMKEANRPEAHLFDDTCACIQCGITRRKIRDGEIKIASDPIEIAGTRTLSVEIAGQRIELCESCAKRYLRI